jgi:PAS domain-containing protein
MPIIVYRPISFVLIDREITDITTIRKNKIAIETPLLSELIAAGSGFYFRERRVAHETDPLLCKKVKLLKYTSTLMEAWRLSISGVSYTLISSCPYHLDSHLMNTILKTLQRPLEYLRQSVTGSAVSASPCFWAFKILQQSYMDLIEQKIESGAYRDICRSKTERFFDRMELGFCSEWCSKTENAKIEELQTKNREILNEKNRYLTIFETIHAPVVLINEENRVENYNQAWNELFEESSIPGSIYYNRDIKPGKKVPGFMDVILPVLRDDINDYTLEKQLVTKNGVRTFQIRIKRMLDISEKNRGLVIILNDITDIKKAEKDKVRKEKLEGVLEMAGAVCHEINQPLQVVMGQSEIIKMITAKDAPIQKNLNTIVAQTEKMGEITKKLMNITKYETKPYLKGTIINNDKASPDKNSSG